MSSGLDGNHGSSEAKKVEDVTTRRISSLSSLATKRELRRALIRSTNPARTIQTFQQEYSLHTMMSRAFGTTARHEMKKTRSQEKQTEESLDTDSVMKFLSHLGVRQYEVHKRITDSLMKQLEEEIRNSQNTEALLDLLKSSWAYATALPELRPVLWAVLKKLGEETPRPVLQALTERDQDGKLRYPEVFGRLPPLIKRLCWEADWENRLPLADADSRTLEEYQETLFYTSIESIIELYCNDTTLVMAANKLFVATVRERRVATKQRRALTSMVTTSSGEAGSGKHNEATATVDSGKAISRLRSLLCDTVGTSPTFRPKLLYALFSVIMAHHGHCTEHILGGARNLRCSLIADILLSAGGPLPRGYQHVVALAHILDDCVHEGNITDAAVKRVQEFLRIIFVSDDDANYSIKSEQSNLSSSLKSMQKHEKNERFSLAILRRLNKIITAGIDAMKDADPQSLFLNPVTDSIAPGYSKIIRKAICISQMEAKVDKNGYSDIDEWEKDVKLMFKNCIDYNQGAAGQWFRGEALRQGRVFREEIFPQATRLFASEIATRNFNDAGDDDGDGVAAAQKRKVLSDEAEITPLLASNKKRKRGGQDDYLPSMPGLASMLLADPFFLRIMLDRILRDLRQGVMKGVSIPAAHAVAPSLLQILHIANLSRQLCATGGQRYFIPDCGLQKIVSDSALMTVPFETLRRIVPLVLRLLLEAELDRRVAFGGDLHSVAQLPDAAVPQSIRKEMWRAEHPTEVSVRLMQGVIIFLCQPGLGNEASLAVTFPKFASSLQSLCPQLCEDPVFFRCLSDMLIRHKAKLPKSTRDSIVKCWLNWLEADACGSLYTPAHFFLIRLFNEWLAFGNSVLPRDALVQFALDTVKAVDAARGAENSDISFASIWRRSDIPAFASIKEQYERMLKHLPEAHANQWKKGAGILQDHDATQIT